MTHDSIGLGEDGPTHQPVEHLAALRAIPNLLTMRPCDGVETAECWEFALNHKTGPSLMALTRQNLLPMRKDTGENKCAKGGYVLQEASKTPQVVLIATGSEIEIAAAAQKTLEGEGIAARLVSMPCMELFAQQVAAYRQSVLGPKGMARVAVEAGIRQCWDRWLGENGAFVGMSGFGESAPYKELYKFFGITPEAVVKAAKERLV
jgi:transketolase